MQLHLVYDLDYFNGRVQVLARIDDVTPNVVAFTDEPAIVVALADAWTRGAAVPLRVEADPDGAPLRVVSVGLNADEWTIPPVPAPDAVLVAELGVGPDETYARFADGRSGTVPAPLATPLLLAALRTGAGVTYLHFDDDVGILRFKLNRG